MRRSDPSANKSVPDPDNSDIDELPGEFTPSDEDKVTSLQDEIDALPDLDGEGEPGAGKG